MWTKYQKLGKDCQKSGWKTRCILVEIGTKGFNGRSLSKVYGALGLTRTAAVRNNMDTAEKHPEEWTNRDSRWSLGLSLIQVAWKRVSVVRPKTLNGFMKCHWWWVQANQRILNWYIQTILIWLGYTCNIRSNEQQSLLSFIIWSYVIPQAQTFMGTVVRKTEISQEFVWARLFQQQRWASVAH